MTPSLRSLLPVLLTLAIPVQAPAQIVEAVGSRALGMGGAFVAVANDSSATWWNPGGLGGGPFLDFAIARAVTERNQQLPARRDRASWLAVGSPPFGFSYYRLRITEVAPSDPTEPGDGGREDGQGGVPVRSLSATQLGLTVVQTLLTGVHVGTTVKYVRGTARSGVGDPLVAVDDLLDYGDDLDGGETHNRFDLDIGVHATGGPVSVGAVVRNLLEPEFGFEGLEGTEPLRLPRQVRIGVAFDGSKMGAVPLTVAFDADVQRYATVSGDRRVIAIGAEQWLFRKRLAVRGGGRFNTVGAEERAATAGVSVLLRSKVYLDGHLVRGGVADEQGWGVATRVSF